VIPPTTAPVPAPRISESRKLAHPFIVSIATNPTKSFALILAPLIIYYALSMPLAHGQTLHFHQPLPNITRHQDHRNHHQKPKFHTPMIPIKIP
jgi:hypothetical protein